MEFTVAVLVDGTFNRTDLCLKKKGRRLLKHQMLTFSSHDDVDDGDDDDFALRYLIKVRK